MKTFKKLKIRPVNVKDLRSARSCYREYNPVHLALDDVKFGDIVYLRGTNYPWVLVDDLAVKKNHTIFIHSARQHISDYKQIFKRRQLHNTQKQHIPAEFQHSLL